MRFFLRQSFTGEKSSVVQTVGGQYSRRGVCAVEPAADVIGLRFGIGSDGRILSGRASLRPPFVWRQ